MQCRDGHWSDSSFECHLRPASPPSTTSTTTIAITSWTTSNSSSTTRVSYSSLSSPSFSTTDNFESIYPPSSPSSNQPKSRPQPSKSSFPSSPSSNQPFSPPPHLPTTSEDRGRIINHNVNPDHSRPFEESEEGPVWPMNGPRVYMKISFQLSTITKPGIVIF